MSPIKRRWLGVATGTVVIAGTQLFASPAHAEPAPPSPAPTSQAAAAVQHNVTYRARADGTSRGAVVAYKIDDNNVNSDQPTLLPGMTFEVNTVLEDPKNAGMEISIQWPYGSNLHCEILVDDHRVPVLSATGSTAMGRAVAPRLAARFARLYRHARLG